MCQSRVVLVLFLVINEAIREQSLTIRRTGIQGAEGGGARHTCYGHELSTYNPQYFQAKKLEGFTQFVIKSFYRD